MMESASEPAPVGILSLIIQPRDDFYVSSVQATETAAAVKNPDESKDSAETMVVGGDSLESSTQTDPVVIFVGDIDLMKRRIEQMRTEFPGFTTAGGLIQLELTDEESERSERSLSQNEENVKHGKKKSPDAVVATSQPKKKPKHFVHDDSLSEVVEIETDEEAVNLGNQKLKSKKGVDKELKSKKVLDKEHKSKKAVEKELKSKKIVDKEHNSKKVMDQNGKPRTIVIRESKPKKTLNQKSKSEKTVSQKQPESEKTVDKKIKSKKTAKQKQKICIELDDDDEDRMETRDCVEDAKSLTIFQDCVSSSSTAAQKKKNTKDKASEANVCEEVQPVPAESESRRMSLRLRSSSVSPLSASFYRLFN